ncbi:MAG: hypothetical protein Q9217_003409 [Psora testacea]
MLVRLLVDEHDPVYGLGSMTCSIYDTAWVAMVTKQISGQTRWLFPSAFDFLLKSQHDDGGWYTSASNIDSILNTLAALLALCKHIAAPDQIIPPSSEDLYYRQIRAIYYLETRLSVWEVSATSMNGFEILVFKLLQLLAVEGVEFDFPGLQALNECKAKFAAKFNASMLYGTVRTSTARFLEGLIGEIDFDRMAQHGISGSIMASPASTAAYLMYTSTWDDEAEAYLAHVLSIGDARSVGGVPSQYPTTVFEVTQSISVLLAHGFSAEDLGVSHLENAGDFLEACLLIDAGVTGSAPYVESDADNTAKALSTLCLLGRTPNPQGLVVRFQTRDFFKTYTHERKPSFRTNCLVLKALLDLLPTNSEQAPQIEKTVRFITNYWWTTNGAIDDNSNASLNYPAMLMVDALVRLIDLWDAGFEPVLDDQPLRDKVFICLYQALTRTLQDQNTDGSWGRDQRCETTAYAVLLLTKLAPLSSAPRVKAQLSQAIEKARKFLADSFRAHSEPDHVWRGKTDAGSMVLFQAYVLAALQASNAKSPGGHSVESRFEISLAKIAIQTKYYARQSWFANIPEWQIQACLIESNLFLPQLKDLRFAVFPQGHVKDDQYFDTIPFTWLAASNFDRRFIGAEFLYQMMRVSFLNRQLDDYISNFINEAFAGCLFEVEDIVQNVFDELELYTAKDQCYCDNHNTNILGPSVSTSTTASMRDARAVLYRFISHILNHPAILMASYHDQARLRSEFMAFLLGRINQLPDQPPESASVVCASRPNSASDQTHHTYTFAFLSCLVGNQTLHGSVGLRRDFLDTPEQQYLVAAMCRHLSIISFLLSNASEQHVDHGRQQQTPVKARMSSCGMERHYSRSFTSASNSSSIYSDGDLSPVSAMSSNSSVPDTSPSSQGFYSPLTQTEPQSAAQNSSQSLQLTGLLTHERRCLNVCLQSLDAAGINQRTANILGLFVDLGELSELIFGDPNIGSCHLPTTANEVIEQACILQPSPPSPRRAATPKGSVAAARAALTVEPLSRSRSDPTQSFPENTEQRLTPCQEDIKITSTATLKREWNRNRPIPTLPTRRNSRSPIETSRVEQTIPDMGDSSRTAVPKLKINPMLERYQQNRPRTATEGESAGSSRPVQANAHKRIAGANYIDEESIKLAEARVQTQKKLYHELRKKANRERQAREAEEADAKRRRASGLQAKAMVQAQRAMSTLESTVREVKRDTSPKAKVTMEQNPKEEKGWIRAPPAVKVVELTEEVQAKKLHRASKLEGPRLKLPF